MYDIVQGWFLVKRKIYPLSCSLHIEQEFGVLLYQEQALKIELYNNSPSSILVSYIYAFTRKVSADDLHSIHSLQCLLLQITLHYSVII